MHLKQLRRKLEIRRRRELKRIPKALKSNGKPDKQNKQYRVRSKAYRKLFRQLNSRCQHEYTDWRLVCSLPNAHVREYRTCVLCNYRQEHVRPLDAIGARR